MTSVVDEFARIVGGPDAGPVTCRGGGTQWDLGGVADPSARVVQAPSGVVDHQPGEMIVRVRAATTIAELQAATLTEGQLVPIEAERPDEATVGGVLACGRSGIRRLGRGPLRDAVLEVTAVTSSGRIIRAGAPLVKNVTGFDLCKLVVGSYGSLAFIAEVVLRCIPKPQTERWFCGLDADPFELRSRLYKPLSVLWDGNRTWVGLAGYDVDVTDQARSVIGDGFVEVDGPAYARSVEGRSVEGRFPLRLSMSPGDLRRLRSLGVSQDGPAGEWLAEVGVGVVHCTHGVAALVDAVSPAALTASSSQGGFAAPAALSPPVLELHRRIKASFDPTGRLNPSRTPVVGSMPIPPGKETS